MFSTLLISGQITSVIMRLIVFSVCSSDSRGLRLPQAMMPEWNLMPTMPFIELGGCDIKWDGLGKNRREFRDMSLADENRLHRKIAGKKPSDQMLAFGDEQAAEAVEFLVLEVAVCRHAGRTASRCGS